MANHPAVRSLPVSGPEPTPGRSATAAPPARAPAWHPRSLLSSLAPDDRTTLLRLGVPRGFERGAVLMRLGEPGDEAHLIVDGCVKVLGGNADGHTTLLAVRMAGDIVGELSVLDGRPRSATVEAASPIRVRTIGGRALRAFLHDHPGAGTAVQHNVNAKLREAIGHRTDSSGAPVTLRLVRVLDRLGRYCGRRTEEGLAISVPLSQADLAALVGTTEQSIRRALNVLRSSGVILTRYRSLVITDTDRLSVLAEEAAPESARRRT